MAYDIELIAIGAEITPLLRRSAAALNGLQGEFHFRLATLDLQKEASAFSRDTYNTKEIWTFLREQRKRHGGRRPYIIAFVTRPLESDRLMNLFGSHVADEGLAAVTLDGTAQYVSEEARYCRYYLIRYAMSFVNPLIKSHDDPKRRACYFHKKMLKRDIVASMDSGKLCDDCNQLLENPPDGGAAHQLSVGERGALRKMRDFVSGDLPYAIVMKGGGVKGLAFAGALLEIEEYFYFDRHVGTSAGAIAAVLLAANYTPGEIKTILLNKNFADFMDAPWWRTPFNLILRKGLYSGEGFRLWLADLLRAKSKKIGDILMSDLNGAVVYASSGGVGTLAFDSTGERKDAVAAFATRCSMSIPFFFFPTQVDGRLVYDGGLRNNFPLTRFLADHPQPNFIALYLGKADDTISKRILPDLFNIVLEGEDRKTVDKYTDDVVVIDTSPIGTVDFDLTPNEKQFLLQIGKAAGLRFLLNRKIDGGPTEALVTQAEAEAEDMRKTIVAQRGSTKNRRALVAGSIAVGMVLVFVFGLSR